MIPTTVRRRAAAALALLCVVPLACRGDDATSDDGAVLQQVAPTKAEIAKDAGIVFPPSTSGFRLVRVGDEQIDVTFDAESAEIDAFAEQSGFTLEVGKRAIVHASPLWDVAVTVALRGATSEYGGVERGVEVIEDGEVATVRLTLVPTAGGANS